MNKLINLGQLFEDFKKKEFRAVVNIGKREELTLAKATEIFNENFSAPHGKILLSEPTIEDGEKTYTVEDNYYGEKMYITQKI